jgi:hypothetical protein
VEKLMRFERKILRTIYRPNELTDGTWRIKVNEELDNLIEHKNIGNVERTPEERETPWPESASKLYRPSDRCLSAKLVPTFVSRGCNAVSVTEPHARILGFLDRNRYFFFQVAPQLYS